MAPHPCLRAGRRSLPLEGEGREGGGQEIEMQKWKCKICGYIYDPEKGDPDGNISPNTPFDKLPDDWVCPVCGAPKDMFEKE